MKQWYFFLPALFVLGGCESMNGHFDCPMTAGVMCKNLDQVNTMVDRGEIGTPHQVSASAAQEKTDQNSDHPGSWGHDGSWSNHVAPHKMPEQTMPATFQTYPIAEPWHAGDPLRYGEKIQRVWLAPYEDTQGNYHQASISYAIMQPGYWIGPPVKALAPTP